MKVTIAGKGTEVNLTPSHFKAKGGEGSIYLKGGTAYKICESDKMIPDGKIKELQVLTQPNIIKPEHVLLNTKNKPIGYTMRAVPNNPIPLAQILTKSYRERENVTQTMMSQLISQIRGGIDHIHSKDLLQVDGNEMNYMVTKDYKDLYFIDVNSFETKHYPAEAIMPSIRDWHVKKSGDRHLWTKESDWFSFAIISFQMWTGIHPYKGRHPQFKDMKSMMLGHTSVLNSETKFPKATAYPFDIIPTSWMQWYQAVLEDGKRLVPPTDFQAQLITIKVKEIVGSDNFEIEEVYKNDNNITGYYQYGSQEVIMTKTQLSVNRQNKPILPRKYRVGFTPKKQIPVLAYIGQDRVTMLNLDNLDKIPFTGGGTSLMSCEGRLYVHADQRIYEIVFIESSKLIAAPKIVADVHPHTKLFPGVAIQQLFDGQFLSIFPESGYCYQFHIKELDEYRILEAKYEHNVLMVVGIKDGQYDRFVIRFTDNWQNYEIAFKKEDINFVGINFTVLDNGLCVSITEEEKIEIFSSKYGSQSVKSIEDPVIEGDMRLCHSGSQLMFAKNEKLYKISMK